ncbi:hypothetical protein RRG08_017014 [Elysia crispata]|uniref:Uncharacterized protein n=1 Tax=Elysia crispata TaxID=231223 RepID=A0AAE1CPU3_9GAST|nr:hypothetical protein RRG08_017014 [Elysia crispata]
MTVISRLTPAYTDCQVLPSLAVHREPVAAPTASCELSHQFSVLLRLIPSPMFLTSPWGFAFLLDPNWLTFESWGNLRPKYVKRERPQKVNWEIKKCSKERFLNPLVST